MRGRKDVSVSKKDSYKRVLEPNYDSISPHLYSIFFNHSNSISERNYKNYMIGKRIRAYDCNSSEYFIMNYKNEKENNIWVFTKMKIIFYKKK